MSGCRRDAKTSAKGTGLEYLFGVMQQVCSPCNASLKERR